MAELHALTDLRSLLLADVPLLDVRAPVEFAQGAFPMARNLPLMNDAERHAVGTCYVQQGQQAAIALGHQLVAGDVKDARVADWAAFARANPQGVLYCFRGGLRSQISQQWLHEAGIDYPRVHGGYKALRSLLLQTTEAAARECGFVVLGGLTGTGKTELIAALANGLDLEGHANHRGSSFGQRVQGQPTQINFENSLAIDVMKQRAQGVAHFVVEDEGRHVGACSVPLPLRERLEGAPRVYLTEAFDARVERILHDYVVSQLAEFAQRDGEAAGFDAFAHWLQASLLRLSKRLGGARLQTLLAAMEAALAEQRNSGRVDGHRDWIAPLLRDYYDPMYAHQRHLRGDVAAFEGNHAQVQAYLQAHRSD